MSFMSKSPSLTQTAPDAAQQASSYKEADPVPAGWGNDVYGSHWLCKDYNWREAYGGEGKPRWQYCSIAAAYCAGPVARVGRVFADGKVITAINYTFDPGEHFKVFTINPSLALGAAWKVTIYRGTEGQPVDAALATGSGLVHPPYAGICYAVWENIDLGAGNTSLPALALELLRETPAVGDYPAGGHTVYGVNPFAAIHALCLDEKGGLDMNPGMLDAAHWGELATQLEAVGVGSRTGNLVKCHPVFAQVKDAGAMLAQVLAYVGGFIYTAGGKLRGGWFPRAAAPDDLPELSEHDLENKPSGGTFPDWNQGATSVAVVFRNEARAYKEDVALDQQPANRELGVLSIPARADRQLIHDAAQAAAVAAELSLDTAADTTVSLSVFKSRAVKGDGSPLMPGDLFNWDYGPHALDLVCRVVSRRMRSDTASDILQVVRERGAFPTPYVPPVDDREVQPPAEPGEINPANVRLWFLPRALALSLDANEPRQVAALVDRAHQGIISAVISMSPTGSVYEELVDQRYFAAKCLATNGGISGASATLRVSTASVDFAAFAAASAVAQVDDTLLLLIGDELVSVGAITPVSPGVFDLGILRGRQGTAAAAHADGAACWLFLRSELRATQHLEYWNVRTAGAYHAGTATKLFKIKLQTIDVVGDPKPDAGISLQLPDLAADDKVGYSVELTSPARAIACDSFGTPLAGQLGFGGAATCDVKVFRGTAALTAVSSGPNSDQFSATIAATSNASGTKEDADTFRADSLTADAGSLSIDVLVAGVFTVRKLFTLTKAKGGATGSTGSTGSTGATGNSVERRYIRSTLVPGTPFGSNPLGWTVAIPAGTDALWVSEATKDAGGNVIGSWSTPQRLEGNVVFYQTSAPSTGSYTLIEGDLWFDTDDGNRPHRWESGSWVAKPFGDAAIANLSVGKLTAGTIQAAISIGTLGSLSAGSGFSQFWVDTGQLKYGAFLMKAIPGVDGNFINMGRFDGFGNFQTGFFANGWNNDGNVGLNYNGAQAIAGVASSGEWTAKFIRASSSSNPRSTSAPLYTPGGAWIGSDLDLRGDLHLPNGSDINCGGDIYLGVGGTNRWLYDGNGNRLLQQRYGFANPGASADATAEWCRQVLLHHGLGF